VNLVAETSLAVSEVFGPTVQGEGPSMGRRAGFIRLARCNLACRWCDTPYTWDWKGVNGTPYDPRVEITPSTVRELVEAVGAMDVPLVVITGGEPMLQATGLLELAQALTSRGYDVEVETNGTLPPGDLCGLVTFNVSPKLADSEAAPIARRIKPEILADYARCPSTAFKFVVSTVDQLGEVAGVVQLSKALPEQVWIMPEGTDPAALTSRLAALADPVVARGWNLTTRLHVLAWGNQRGV